VTYSGTQHVSSYKIKFILRYIVNTLITSPTNTLFMQSNFMNYHLKKFKQDYNGIKKKKRRKEKASVHHLIGREEVDFFFLNAS